MASPFKIPKKKQTSHSDSTHLHVQSPLSRLQSSSPQLKSYEAQSDRSGSDRMHSGSSLGSTSHRKSESCQPLFRNVVKTLLGLSSPDSGASTANHRVAGNQSSQSQPRQRTELTSACFSNRWRPKRASDRLLQPGVNPEPPSPPQKKKSMPCASSAGRISLDSVDSLAELRGAEHARTSNSHVERRWKRAESDRDATKGKDSSADQTSEDDFTSPIRSSNKSSGHESPFRGRPGRQSMDGMVLEERREKERRKWKEFQEMKKRTPHRSAVLQLRRKSPRQTTEPIVLSSEEEEEEEEEEGEDDGGGRGSSRVEKPHPGGSGQVQSRLASSSKGDPNHYEPPPSFMQLDFLSFHAGLRQADANGEMLITETGIMIPLKGAEEGQISVVASQVRGYGVWDGGVARCGTLLTGWKGPAPTLLFLWVTDAQANLLQMELSAIQTASSTSGPACSFLLLVLKEQLQELQAALLASILDMEEYRVSSSSGPASPLEWTDGLLLLHSAPPPLDQHLLQLLGCSVETSSQVKTNQKNKNQNSSGLQQLPTRLIQYPPPPCKGGITVTKEDLACLNDGEFLNDVIIDFYLKYLLLEGVGGSAAERSHVFSSFFYKQLSRRRAAGENEAPTLPDRKMRHQRVKTWTRHVDIFTKDFLFVPVNQEAHWFLVLICFPGLEELQSKTCRGTTGGSEQAARAPLLRSQQPQDCSEWGNTVMKRPCILVMDSLKLSYHENVCRLLRDYLQVEWEVRRATPRIFTSQNMRSSKCRVPQQDNSSDCGLYLLQYAESFLQNPVERFDLPLQLQNWFPRQQVRQKRKEIRSLIMRMHQSQKRG